MMSLHGVTRTYPALHSEVLQKSKLDDDGVQAGEGHPFPLAAEFVCHESGWLTILRANCQARLCAIVD
jgi:hypothetical protein